MSPCLCYGSGATPVEGEQVHEGVHLLVHAVLWLLAACTFWPIVGHNGDDCIWYWTDAGLNTLSYTSRM